MGDRNRINIRTGEPVRIVFETDPLDAREVQNPRTNAIEFMLIGDDDSSIMFVPAEAIHILQEAGAQPGHLVEITKLKRGWQAKVLEPDSDAPPAAPPPPTPPAPVRQMADARARTPAPRGSSALAPAPETRAETAIRQQAQLAQYIAASGANANALSQRPGAGLVAGAMLTAIDAAVLCRGLRPRQRPGRRICRRGHPPRRDLPL